MLGDGGRAPVREVRALEMLRDGERIQELSDHEFIVGSQTGRGFYRVRTDQSKGLVETCTCPDFAERLAACKHIYAVRHWLRAANSDEPRSDLPLPPSASQAGGHQLVSLQRLPD
jgi:hypothetical protein